MIIISWIAIIITNSWIGYRAGYYAGVFDSSKKINGLGLEDQVKVLEQLNELRVWPNKEGSKRF